MNQETLDFLDSKITELSLQRAEMIGKQLKAESAILLMEIGFLVPLRDEIKQFINDRKNNHESN